MRWLALVVAFGVMVGLEAASAWACPPGFTLEVLDGPIECAPCMQGHSCPCGPTKIQTCVQGNQKNGAFERTDLNGRVLEQGTFKDGAKEGAWIEATQDARNQKHLTYVHGVLEGAAEELIDGRTFKGAYKQGKKQGRWTITNADGSLGSDGDYDKGERSGEWHIYNSAHHLAWHEVHTGADALLEHYYDDGKNLLERGKTHQDKRVGVWEVFDQNGQLVERATYDMERKTGPYEAYRADGTPVSKGVYKDGSEIGEWRFWAPDGKLWLIRRHFPDEKGPEKVLDTTRTNARVVHIRSYGTVFEEEYPFITCPAGSKRQLWVKPDEAVQWCKTSSGAQSGPYQRWRVQPSGKAFMWFLLERGEMHDGKRIGKWVDNTRLVDHGP